MTARQRVYGKWAGNLLAAGLLVAWLGPLHAQAPPASPERLPQPRPVQAAAGDGSMGTAGPKPCTLPIDLPTALRLAQTNNLDIAQAREAVKFAQANLERAWVQLLPNLNVGSTFVDHDGRIQQAVGNILNSNRNSLYVGGGPSVAVQFNDVIFAPLAARQILNASTAGVQRVTNDTLLAVADAYFGVLRARRRYARVLETLEFLTSDRPSESRGKSKGLLPLVRDIVEAGGKDAFRSDLERMRVEVFRRQEEGAAALQEYGVASAELSRLLRLDSTCLLCPIEDFRFPLPLPGEQYYHQDIEDLAALALNNRPELAENRALVQAALDRLRAAKFRPLLPSVVVNYSAGGFGGSPNFVRKTQGTGLGIGTALTQSGRIDDFGSRSDFDVSLVWRLNNMGFGNQAEIREQKALYEQNVLRQLAIQDRVVAQVVQAYDQVRQGSERVTITRSALFDDQGRPTGPVYLSIRLNFERIRGAEGRALEVLDSVRGLNDILEQYANSMTDFDRGRFRLLIALGLPPEALIGPVPCGEWGANPVEPEAVEGPK